MGATLIADDPAMVSYFKNTLKIELEKVKSESYGELEAVFLKELNKHAPLKKEVSKT